MKKNGVVYLVGAGPGDPGLITQKGLKRLAAAMHWFMTPLLRIISSMRYRTIAERSM